MVVWRALVALGAAQFGLRHAMVSLPPGLTQPGSFAGRQNRGIQENAVIQLIPAANEFNL